MKNASLVEMKGTTKRFLGVLANDRVDFDIKFGEIHAKRLAFNSRKVAALAVKTWYDNNNLALQDRKIPWPKALRARKFTEPMSLKDVRDLIVNGKPSPFVKAVILVALQSGMGRAEIMESFGADGLGQLMAEFGEDISHWKFDGKTPFLIRATRKKTGMPYYTFISTDALEAIKVYLLDREKRKGAKLKPSDRLFVELEYLHNVGHAINKVAERANLADKTSSHRYRIHLHALRSLFKTVCSEAGIPVEYSEFMLGHEFDKYQYDKLPNHRDSEGNKTGEERFRETYRKSESRLNVMTGIGQLKLEELRKKTEADMRKLEDENEQLRSEIKQVRTTLEQMQRQTDDGALREAITRQLQKLPVYQLLSGMSGASLLQSLRPKRQKGKARGKAVKSAEATPSSLRQKQITDRDMEIAYRKTAKALKETQSV